MARLLQISFTPFRTAIEEGVIQHRITKGAETLKYFPAIVWSDSSPWREVNLWAHQRATASTVTIKTVQSNMRSLAYYASWLESNDLDWWHFPAKKQDRCLLRFRGHLIKARDGGELSPSTVSQRMRDVISFYKWLKATGLLKPEWPMWTDRTAKIVLVNQFGFERTMSVSTTDLSIPNRTRPGERLEDGLLPVSAIDRSAILKVTKEHASMELYLMLQLGFFTGMRLGTICDLKVETLHNAVPDPTTPAMYRLNVGPGAKPSVQTKFGVTGQVWITERHLNLLLDYSISRRRLMRQLRADPSSKDLVFITRYGNSYSATGSSSSPVNVEMLSLRKKGSILGVNALGGFHFHQSRCTYATELAKILIPKGGAINALAIIKEALLHKDEATSLKYIRFVEKTPAKIAVANEFSRLLMGDILGDLPK